MIQVNEIAFVGYPTTDKKRACAFYGDVLGLKSSMDMDMGEHYWTEFDAGYSTIGISNYWKPAAEPLMGPIAAFEVPDIQKTIADLKAKGIRFPDKVHESIFCHMTPALDPDGNSIWIHQRKPERGAYAGPEVPFVAYPFTDKQRAVDFYSGLLGLKRSSGHDLPDGYWYEYEIGPGTLVLCSYWKPSAEPSMGPAIAFEVENFETAVAELKAKDVPFPLEPMESPGCHLCVVTDPDGNSLFIHKRKPGHN